MLRFWNKIHKTSYCWLWIGSRTPQSHYGRILFRGKNIGAHRLSWILHYGKIPQGLDVCHKCDNPPCVRPSHLFVGTKKQNSQDSWKKGRAYIPKTQHGETHHSAKLTKEQVRLIRLEHYPYSRKVSYPRLAEKYGVSSELIAQIIKRKIWREL